jgi:MFS family permease
MNAVPDENVDGRRKQMNATEHLEVDATPIALHDPPASTTNERPETTSAVSAPAATSAVSAPAPTETAPATSLWRNWRFQALWVGSSTSLLGINAADFAYPLVILLMTHSPALAAVFGFVQTAAMTLAGLPAGVLVDRWDRRRMLMGAEALRAVTTASVLAAWAVGHLTIAHLFVVAAVLGAVTPVGGSARMLMVRAVVPPAQLTQALTQDEVRTAAAGLGGPPLGGLLLAASRGLPFLFTTITFLISFVTALIVRVPGGAKAPATVPEAAAKADTASAPAPEAAAEPKPADAGGGMLAGVRALWHDRTMRGALAMFSLINVGGSALFLAVVVLLQQQGASPRLIGIAVAGEAVGTLLGAGLVGRLHRRVAPGWLLIGVGVIFTLFVPLLAVRLGPWWVFGVLTVGVLGVPSLRVLIDVLILRRVPDAQRGRTITALMTVLTIGIPIGTLAGGLSLQYAGPTPTILAIGVLNALAVAMAASDRRLRAARWPAQ